MVLCTFRKVCAIFSLENVSIVLFTGYLCSCVAIKKNTSGRLDRSEVVFRRMQYLLQVSTLKDQFSAENLHKMCGYSNLLSITPDPDSSTQMDEWLAWLLRSSFRTSRTMCSRSSAFNLSTCLCYFVSFLHEMSTLSSNT